MALTEKSFKRLSEHLGFFSHSTNVGAIFSGAEIFLTDSGAGEDDGIQLEKICRALFCEKKITNIFHTHCHADHCSGSIHFQKNPEIKLWSTNFSSHLMQVPSSVTSIYCGGKTISEFEIPQFRLSSPIRTDRIISEEEIDFQDVKLKFIFLPGHFFDQAGILAEDKSDGTKAFFLGDGFFGMELLKKTWIPFMTNPEKFRESVKKIESVSADFYVPGHGSVCTAQNIHAAAEINQMVTYEMESLILKSMEKGFCRTEEILKQVADYSGIRMKIIPFHLIGTTLKSYLACMEKQGKIFCEIQDNELAWRKK
jgi:glyoxylase-like metal-dependent hydrolase (beta-lactamase superfamily II)